VNIGGVGGGGDGDGEGDGDATKRWACEQSKLHISSSPFLMSLHAIKINAK
jgi:hypothetical protein